MRSHCLTTNVCQSTSKLVFRSFISSSSLTKPQTAQNIIKIPEKIPKKDFPKETKDLSSSAVDFAIEKSFSSFKSPAAGRLWSVYRKAKMASDKNSLSNLVNPKAVFCNNTLDLSKIDAWGFDYDYTLAIYKMELNRLIYTNALEHLINWKKYPSGLRDIPYDPKFVIRGLHFDIHTGLMLKLDASLTIQYGSVYRGKMALGDCEVDDIYGGNYIANSYLEPDRSGLRPMYQLTDLFSLPEAGLLINLIDYLENGRMSYTPMGVFKDVQAAVRDVHLSGTLYRSVNQDLDKYVHKNPGLVEFLNRQLNAKKMLFLITNSPFDFINKGMNFLIGPDWRDLFDFIVVQAGKPGFFKYLTPFREYNLQDKCLNWQKISSLEKGKVYGEGNINDFAHQAALRNRGVLYLGDHVYSDLADPTLEHGWHTGGIVAELEREIKTQNSTSFAYCAQWLQVLSSLIEIYQDEARVTPETAEIMTLWNEEREQIRNRMKSLFNPQFGSIFRTYYNPSLFMRRLSRLSDVYTSRLPNFLHYSQDHCFAPRRSPLAHESSYSMVPEKLGMVQFVDQEKFGTTEPYDI